jgi:hypothetical protein
VDTTFVGTGVAVGGTGVAVGGTAVAVGGTGVAVGGTDVGVGGTTVAADCVGVAAAKMFSLGPRGILVKKTAAHATAMIPTRITAPLIHIHRREVFILALLSQHPVHL